MNIFAKRFKMALDMKNMKPVDISEKTGISRSLISQYLKGSFRPKQVRTEQIANALGVSVAFLLGYNADEDELDVFPESIVAFPVIGEVAAGYDSLAQEEETGETEQIPLSWLRGLSPNEFFVLKVKGDSMYPDYQHGDCVLIRKTNTVDSGAVAIVGYDTDNATLKRVEYVKGEDWMKLIPRNHEYAPKIIEGSDLELCRVYGEAWSLIRHVK